MECKGSHFSTGGHFSPPGLGVMTRFLQAKNDPFGRRKWTPVTFLRRKMTGGRFSMGVVIRRYTGTGQRLALHMFLVRRSFPQVTYFHFAYAIGGRPYDSEGGGGGWHFVEINILTLKMLKINNLSSSVKETNNLTLTFLQFGGGLPIFPIYFCKLRSQQLNSQIFFRLTSLEILKQWYSYPTLNTFTYSV